MISRRYVHVVIHMLWWIVFALAMSVFIVSKWQGYISLQTLCEQLGQCENPMQLTERAARDLAGYGIATSMYSGLLVIFMSISNLTYIAVAGLVYYYGRRDSFCVEVSAFLVIIGTIFCTDETALHNMPAILAIFHGLDSVGSFYLAFLYVLPDGRYAPRWTMLPSAIWIIAQGYRIIAPEQWSVLSWNPLFMITLLIITHVPLLFSIQYRLQRASSPNTKRHLRWLAYGLICYVVGGMIMVLPYLLQSGLLQLVVQLSFYGSLMIWPLAIGINVLEHRLLTAKGMLHRALVYTLLSYFITLLYAFSVLGFSLLLQGNNPLVSLLAGGVIAVLFHPIHIRLQKAVSRLVQGDAESPYQSLTRMMDRMETIGRERSAWMDVVRGLAQALSLNYVCLYRDQVIIAEFGEKGTAETRIPLQWESSEVGTLVIQAYEAVESMSEEQVDLLRHLTRHIGFALHMEQLSQELKESKERLVHAREEERKRLRRDLHDGLGAQLASVLMRTETIAEQVKDHSLSTQVNQVQEGIELAIKDIRLLVYALRPPVLDEFGLLFALQELVAKFTDGVKEAQLETNDSLDRLNSTMEIAIYRIAQEAITNAFRHGGADRCKVHIRRSDRIELTIIDDGHGFESTSVVYGVGIRSMQERTEELGGTCHIESSPNGTIVRVTLPILYNVEE